MAANRPAAVIMSGPWQQAQPLELMRARLLLPSQIPPREWLYGTYLLRRHMTLLVAEGGVGKSGLATLICMEVAAGRGVLGNRIHARCNTALFNLEDPLEEMERSVAAAMIHHRFDEEELSGRLFLNSGRERRLMIATRTDMATIVFPDKVALVDAARRARVGLIAVDPFIRSHTLEENSNDDMAQAAEAWCQVAEDAHASLLLIHHRRKGTDPNEGIDAARGGKALSDAARIGLVMNRMSPEEAERADIADKERWRYVRIDDAKVNLSPKIERATWIKLVGVPLNNGTPDYPEGDVVRTIEAWTPQSAFGDLNDEQLNDALNEIAEGPEPGELYTISRRNSSARWAGKVLVSRCGRTEGQAAAILASWIKSGLLVEVEYHSKRNRRDAKGVKVDDTKRPGAPTQ
jgi:hypothetical protein